MVEYTTRKLAIPVKMTGRLEECLIRAVKLSEEDYNMFIDDILTSMENRLKVLKV